MSPIVISASRRTDIPAFYLPWFMASIQKGTFKVINPYNQKSSLVPATPDQVHSIVFWSKDFGPFLRDGYGDRLSRLGYRFFFNFTINSTDRFLEPKVPPLEDRLNQLAQLCSRYGAQCVQWRFDPICHLRLPDGSETNNLGDFETIARHAASLGVSNCITSFVDLYHKVLRRSASQSDSEWIDPSLAQKAALVVNLEAILSTLHITLALCCEKQVLAALPAGSTVTAASCIPNHRLAAIFGRGISLSRDHGQRTAAGCGCFVSRDIGSYSSHPCLHDCLFCYANPACDQNALIPSKKSPSHA